MNTLLACPNVRLSESQFLRLVEAASRAPSCDNNQPWAFRLAGGGMDILHRRELALPSDAEDLFSWLSLGAAIENIALTAAMEGLAADVDYRQRPFEIIDGAEHVAHIRFYEADSATADSDLAGQIASRCTNRKLYDPSPIEASVLDRIADCTPPETTHVRWLTSAAQKRRLARLVYLADRVRFESRTFHDEFHAVLRYTVRDAKQTRDGLDIRTIEGPPGTGTILRWLRPWCRMRFANRLGMSRIFAVTSVRQTLRCGAVGMLSAAEAGDASFLEAGRALQRIWLAVTREGLAFQPMGALPLFLHRLASAGARAFTSEHAQVIAGLQAPLADLFPGCDGIPVMLFRIGRAQPPTARSLRYRAASLVCGE